MGGVQEEKKCPVTKISDATRLFTAVFFRWATAFGLALPPGRHNLQPPSCFIRTNLNRAVLPI